MGEYVFSIVDLFPYTVMAFLLILFMYVKGSRKRKALYGLIALFLFAAIRYGIGYDYFAYVAHATQVAKDYSYERLEPFSRVLLEVGYYTHYQVFFVIGSLLTVLPVYLACVRLSRKITAIIAASPKTAARIGLSVSADIMMPIAMQTRLHRKNPR